MADLPLLAVFDLDNTIWHPSIHEYYARNSKHSTPRAGRDIALCRDVVPLMTELRSRGIKVAIASRLHPREVGMGLLDQFELLPRIDYIEIRPEDKTVHFRALSAASGIPCNRMIFFDDLRDGRYGNCVPVSSILRLFSVHCPCGVSKAVVRRGFENYQAWVSGPSAHHGAVSEEDGGVTILTHPLPAPSPLVSVPARLVVDTPTYEEQQFIDIGFSVMRITGRWNLVASNRFRATFGASPAVCSLLWEKLNKHSPPFATGNTFRHRDHLMWALMWMKQYPTESAMRNQIEGGADEKTIRKWVKFYVKAVRSLVKHVVRWEDRKEKSVGSSCLVVVDGTDFAINSQNPEVNGKRWFSIKKKIYGPAVKYEVATCIQTGKLVWVHGPFKGGTPDKTIFRHKLIHMMEPGERAEADAGYTGLPDHIAMPVDARAPHGPGQLSKSLARRRHETANGVFKFWGCLNSVYRHDIDFHQDVFYACAVLVQLKIECGDPLFQVEYNLP